MRRFLDIFKETSQTELTSVPSLPDDLSYSDLMHMTKRGFIAMKAAGYLEMDASITDRLFLSSLSSVSCDYTGEKGSHYELIYLSEMLLQWIQSKEQISQRIDELPTDDQIKNALLKAFEIHKRNLTTAEVQTKPAPKDQFDEKWKVYRDVMYAATQGKFLLISDEEMKDYLGGKILMEKEIKQLSDIPECRRATREKLEQKGYNQSVMMGWLLVISEAVTNTLKHADKGKITLVEDRSKGEFRVIVGDKGPGFDLENLPQAALMAGYSTKKSLGQGFHIMLKMSEQVLLHTSEHGSTLILIFHVQEAGGRINETGS